MENKDKKSLNRDYWTHIIKPIGNKLGYKQGKEQELFVHYPFKVMFLSRMMKSKLGGFVYVESTKNLSYDQFLLFINKVIKYSEEKLNLKVKLRYVKKIHSQGKDKQEQL